MISNYLLYIYYGLVFLSGLFVGSFLNLVSDRLLKGGSIVFDRSKCDFCNKPLSWKNLFPVFSFLFQKGKCSYCTEKLSWYYPISEILTGALFVVAAHITNIFQDSTQGIYPFIGFVFVSVVFSFFVVLFMTDAKEKVIPSKVVFPAIIFSLMFLVVNFVISMFIFRKTLLADEFGKYLYDAGYWHQNVYSGLWNLGILLVSTLCIVLFFSFLIWITRGRGMGSGDVPLAALIGIFNGFPYNILAIFIGFVLGSVISLVLVVTKKKTMKDTIPFGPFLIMGSVFSLIWGQVILDWYFKLFGN